MACFETVKSCQAGLGKDGGNGRLPPRHAERSPAGRSRSTSRVELAQDKLKSKHVAGRACSVLPLRPMRRFWVYILRCGDGSYYTGVTNNLETRVVQHKEGLDKNAYTYQRRPVELFYAEEFDSIDTAIQWEKKLQGWSRKKKEALIAGDWDRVHLLAMNKKNREKLVQSERG
jgi:putative endonuclease